MRGCPAITEMKAVSRESFFLPGQARQTRSEEPVMSLPSSTRLSRAIDNKAYLFLGE